MSYTSPAGSGCWDGRAGLDTRRGAQAREFTRRRLEGRRVRLQLADDPTDDRNRYLAYVWTDRTRAKSFNEELLESGLATLQIREGNKRWEDALRAAALRATQRGVGLWRDCPKPEFGG